jgi:hypothetical protein
VAITSQQMVQSTFADLDAWNARTNSVFTPNAGSDLALDDEDWVPWRMSQLAICGLAAAHDHLDAVRVHFEARRGFPLATETLIRGALLGAAQAVWMLAPADRDKRLDYSRCLAAEMYKRHREYLGDLREIDPTRTHASTETVFAHVAQREHELAAKRAAAGQARKFEATRVIEDAAMATMGKHVATEARTVWRGLSGAAHGLIWPALGRPGSAMTGPADRDGLAPMVTQGSWDASVNGYMFAYHLSAKGWELLDKRGTTPAT